MKYKAQNIKLKRIDGAQAEYTTTSNEPFKEANEILQQWAKTAPVKSPFHVVEFSIIYEDNSIYNGKYELKYQDHDYGELIEYHMTGNIEYKAGLAINPHIGQAKYKQLMETDEFKPKIEFYRNFLLKYYIGDGIKHEAVESRKINYETNINYLNNKIFQLEQKIPQHENAVLSLLKKIEYSTGFVEGVKTILKLTRSNRSSEIDEFLSKQNSICNSIEKEIADKELQINTGKLTRSLSEEMIDIICTPNKSLSYFQGKFKGALEATELLTNIPTKKYKN